MSINLRRLRAGEMPSPTEWNRLVDLVEQLTRVSGSGDAEISFSQTGIQVYDNRPTEHWARIIRRPAEHEDGESPIGNKYAHKQVDVDGDGTVTDLPEESGFIFGTPDYLPAVEVNESGDVPDGKVVRLVPSRVGPWFEFDASGGGGAGIEWFRCTSETVDGDGRYPGRYDTYDPDTDTWTTGDLVALEVAEGVFLKEGMRYRGKPTSDPGVFTVTGGASYNTDDDEYRSGFVEVDAQYWTGDKYLQGAWISYPAPPGKDVGGEYTTISESDYTLGRVTATGPAGGSVAYATIQSKAGEGVFQAGADGKAFSTVGASNGYSYLTLTASGDPENVIGAEVSSIISEIYVWNTDGRGPRIFATAAIKQVFGFWNWAGKEDTTTNPLVYHIGDVILGSYVSTTDSSFTDNVRANDRAFGVMRLISGTPFLERGVDADFAVQRVDSKTGADAGFLTLRYRGGLLTGVGGISVEAPPMPAFSGNNHNSLDDDYLAYQDEESITDTLRAILSASQKITGEAPPPPPPPPP